MQTLFFTGYPGFLGSELIQALLPKLSDSKAVCLIQSKYKADAEKARDALYKKNPVLKNRIEFVEGDITRPDLGIQVPGFDRASITQFFHLAAVYDLGVKKEIAERINVTGTIHTLEFARKLPNLVRYQYVSTCYVSGKYAGTFHETDLDVGQSFNNYYEETKFKAELEVQKYMKDGLPATIYRPAIVVGNSHTGETQKFDGPYFVMQWLLRQPKGFALLPTIGNPDQHTLNVVPSDFVIEAITYLSQEASSLGKTFNLADPKPLTIRELVENLGEVTDRKIVALPLSLAVAKAAFTVIPGASAFMRIPKSTLNYFVHPTRYGTSLTQAALTNGKISVPGFKTYSLKLVEFMKNHPQIRSKPMI